MVRLLRLNPGGASLSLVTPLILLLDPPRLLLPRYFLMPVTRHALLLRPLALDLLLPHCPATVLLLLFGFRGPVA
jgi:hypothetical protein